jgi:hypothetical protein
MKLFKLRLIILICYAVSFSCKKKENPVPPDVKTSPVVPVPTPIPTPAPTPAPAPAPVPVPVEEKPLIPIKLELDKTVISFKYLQQTGNLTSIENSDGTMELYSYDANNQLNKYERFSNGEKTYAVYYIRDKQGNVIQANQNKVEYSGTLLTPAGTYKIEYNTDNNVNKVTWYDNSGHILSESIRIYNASGAVLKSTTTGQNANVYNYTYDDKNAWCKQVNFSQILSIESMNSLFLSSVNNIRTSSEEAGTASETSYTYTYNPNNYPTSWVETDSKGAALTYKITYR